MSCMTVKELRALTADIAVKVRLECCEGLKSWWMENWLRIAKLRDMKQPALPINAKLA